jgi:hypothetical protein
MPIAQPSAIPSKPTHQTASVVVGVMAGPGAPAIGPPRWRQLTPAAIWTQINVRDHGQSGILNGVAAALKRHGMPPRRLILLGEGTLGRTALELVLQGALACGGLIAIGQLGHALPFRTVSTSAAIRLVVHDDGCTAAPDDLIHALRASDIDERIIRLNAAAANERRVVASAAETFILELVALIGRQGLSRSLQT